MLVKSGLCVVILAVQLTAVTLYPIHASCRITWKFQQIQCLDICETLVAQIGKWGMEKSCESGEKCLYQLKSQTNETLRATHTTPKKHYVDDLTIDFSDAGNGGCLVVGYSTSETWYAILDYGTNYCNLHNLITGSGLDKRVGYSEETSDSDCTQYSSANCEKY